MPDGLAAGLLAAVNPLSGLYANLFGTVTGSLVTSSSFMAVQATGAMAIVVADVPAVHAASDPQRALFTLSILAGVVMLAAGLLKLGSALRFVSNVLRLRGRSDLGTTFMDVLHHYAESLLAMNSKLAIVSANERIQEQLAFTGITDLIGVDNLYEGDERVGATLKRAHADATAWVEDRPRPGEGNQ